MTSEQKLRLPLELQCEWFGFLNVQNAQRLLTLSRGIAAKNADSILKKYSIYKKLCTEYNSQCFKQCHGTVLIETCRHHTRTIREWTDQMQAAISRVKQLRKRELADAQTAEHLREWCADQQHQFDMMNKLITDYRVTLMDMHVHGMELEDGTPPCWVHAQTAAYCRGLQVQYADWAEQRMTSDLRFAKDRYRAASNHWNLTKIEWDLASKEWMEHLEGMAKNMAK